MITQAVMDLFDRIVDKDLLVRRINMAATHVITEAEAQAQSENSFEQLDLFTDYSARQNLQERKMRNWRRSGKCSRPCWKSRKIWQECNPEGNEFAGRGDGKRPQSADWRS